MAGYMLGEKADEDTRFAGRLPGKHGIALQSSSKDVTHVVQWRAQKREDMAVGWVVLDLRAQRTTQVRHERSL